MTKFYRGLKSVGNAMMIAFNEISMLFQRAIRSSISSSSGTNKQKMSFRHAKERIIHTLRSFKPLK